MRAFIAVKLPPKVLMQINKIQESLQEFEGNKTELKNLHLTLKFLGEVSCDNLEGVKTNLRKIKFNKFEGEIKGTGFFDKKDGRGILWLGITNCENLQKEIDDSLEGMFKKENRFMGHLTIGRVKKVVDKKKFVEDLKKINIPKISFIFDNFYLMQSRLKKEGPEYTIIEEYNLN